MLACKHLHDAQRLCMSNIYPISMLRVETPSEQGCPPEQFQDHQPLPALRFFFFKPPWSTKYVSSTTSDSTQREI